MKDEPQRKRNSQCGKRRSIPIVPASCPTRGSELLYATDDEEDEEETVELPGIVVLVDEEMQARWQQLVDRTKVESNEELFDAALQALEWLIDARDNDEAVYRGKKVDGTWKLNPFKLDL